MDILFLPDGELLVATKTGKINILLDPDSGPDSEMIEALNIGNVVCTKNEQGICGVALHPEFGIANR